MSSSKESAKISPTAHYTGYIWLKYGLSDERLRTHLGPVLYTLLQPMMWYSSSLRRGPVLKDFLLARHKLMDYRLEEEIQSGRVTQVIEIAAGMSPRGLRFAKKYGDKITYIEGDLEGMVNRKRAAIGSSLTSNHQVVYIDALAKNGSNSLSEIAKTLDASKGLAIITEGLVNYFDEENVRAMWRNFASVLSQFSHGVYFSDIHLGRQNKTPIANAFSKLLSTFVRGGVYLHFESRENVREALLEAGFSKAEIHKPKDWGDKIEECKAKGANLVRVIDAKV